MPYPLPPRRLSCNRRRLKRRTEDSRRLSPCPPNTVPPTPPTPPEPYPTQPEKPNPHTEPTHYPKRSTHTLVHPLHSSHQHQTLPAYQKPTHQPQDPLARQSTPSAPSGFPPPPSYDRYTLPLLPHDPHHLSRAMSPYESQPVVPHPPTSLCAARAG